MKKLAAALVLLVGCASLPPPSPAARIRAQAEGHLKTCLYVARNTFDDRDCYREVETFCTQRGLEAPCGFDIVYVDPVRRRR